MKKILVVDDEKGVRESLRFSLQDSHEVILACTGQEGIDLYRAEEPDLVILDIMLPDRDGLEVLTSIRKQDPDATVVMLTALTQVKTAVEAMRLGAVDYVTKPFDAEELALQVGTVLRNRGLKEQIRLLREEVGREYPVDRIIFRSRAMTEVLDQAEKVASAPTSVLLLGETGVGKELVARYIHTHGNRRDEPFIPVHCAAIPETLFESELFGHEKGAFTDAHQRQEGRIELAGAGTLFLDEISEIPAPLQVKLLRFLQEGEFTRLGGSVTLKSRARIIAASSRDLKERVAAGTFRDDFYYRLSVVPLEIPPLRERREDIPLLVRFYADHFRRHLGCRSEGFTSEALRRLEDYSWPGNVRELKNIVERIFVLHGNEGIIDADRLPKEVQRTAECSSPVPCGSVPSYAEARREWERTLFRDALERTGWNQSEAARLLRTTRRIVRYKIGKLNLRRERPATRGRGTG